MDVLGFLGAETANVPEVPSVDLSMIVHPPPRDALDATEPAEARASDAGTVCGASGDEAGRVVDALLSSSLPLTG